MPRHSHLPAHVSTDLGCVYPGCVVQIRLALYGGLLALLVPLGIAPVQATPFNESAVGNAEQVIVVTAPNWRSTEGTLHTFEKADGQWRVVQENVRAQLGYGGMVRGTSRRQGTGTTPTGTYAVLSGFGRKADPGTQLDYVQVDRNDAWTYNPRVPRTYNIFQTVNRSWKSYGNYVERLWNMGMQYNYVAVLDYNLPEGPLTTRPDGVRVSQQPPNTSRGGGIFLHVDNGKKTAGCIAIDETVMRSVMRWLDPDKEPHIVISVEKSG